MVRKDSGSRRVLAARGSRHALFLIVAIDVCVVACGRSNVWFPGDAFEGGDGYVGGAGGTAGRGGSSTGGKGGTTGGTGGSSVGGSSVGGSSVGGVGGSIITGGSGGVGGSGGMGPGPFACAGVFPRCDTFRNLIVSSTTTWGIDDFTGGFAVFGDGLSVTDGTELHITGVVNDYAAGVILWFTNCANLTDYKGLTFTIDGMTQAGNVIEFQALTNSDYPWQPEPQFRRGACTAVDPADAWSTCLAPAYKTTLGPQPQAVYWSFISGGYPVPWTPNYGPTELVGFEWHFPYNPAQGSYVVDVTLSDVQLTGTTIPSYCDSGAAGMGGMGGLGGMAGVAGSGAGFGGVAGVAGSAGFAGTGVSGGGMGGISGAAGFAGTAVSGSAGVAGSSGTGGTSGTAGTGGVGGSTGGGTTEGGAPSGGDGSGGV